MICFSSRSPPFSTLDPPSLPFSLISLPSLPTIILALLSLTSWPWSYGLGGDRGRVTGHLRVSLLGLSQEFQSLHGAYLHR